ncbi:MAG: hypothetical protein RIQ52_1610 [Pseudomonadota bacterium]|jgi:hypothetical protein
MSYASINFSSGLITMRMLMLPVILALLSGCATTPPSNPANVCSIFSEQDEWYRHARTSESHWGVPIPVQMAIIKQESSYVEDARPPRVRFLGIPLWRPTTAYGYGQVLDGTWDWYMRQAEKPGADRDDFEDVTDFIGFYSHQAATKLGIRKTDAYNLYLAYHEGLGGYKKRSFMAKQWLLGVAARVADTAFNYERQLQRCRRRLEEELE